MRPHRQPDARLGLAMLLLMLLSWFAGSAQAQSAKPNILVIWGDDIGT